MAQHHRLLDDATCHRAPAARSLRVLIVDDDPVCGELFSLLLTAWGNEVRIAPDGLSGLRAAEIFEPEVVLLDVSMPGMDGQELARRIRALRGYPTATLVAITGDCRRAGCRVSGPSPFDVQITKPADPVQLRGLLECLGRRLPRTAPPSGSAIQSGTIRACVTSLA